MQGDFQRAVGHVQPLGHVGAGGLFVFAQQPGLEGVEKLGFARRLVFGGQGGSGAGHDGFGPLAVEEGIRIAGAGFFGDIEGFAVGAAGLQGYVFLSAAPFQGDAAAMVFGQEVLHGTEEVGAKAALVRRHVVHGGAFEQLRKEVVGEIPRGVFMEHAGADEPVDGVVIVRAQLAHGLPREGRVAARAQDQRPLGGGEVVRTGRVGHGRSISKTRLCNPDQGSSG